MTTPEQFLSGMPHIPINLMGREMVLIQPSSTFFVYFLGLLMILIGIYFLTTRKDHKSRMYWGFGLILWGLSAIVAGTSYQAFGYELKCNGRDHCLFTSNFELVYMLLTAYCINFLVAGTAFTSVGSRGRNWIIKFALVDSILYFIYLLVGATVPIKFLISYEGFMAFIGANFFFMFVLNIIQYKKFKDPLNRILIVIWIGFLVVNAGYFVFLLGGFGTLLYQTRGIWFNENDVLHILLICWTVLIFILLKDKLKDKAFE